MSSKFLLTFYLFLPAAQPNKPRKATGPATGLNAFTYRIPNYTILPPRETDRQARRQTPSPLDPSPPCGAPPLLPSLSISQLRGSSHPGIRPRRPDREVRSTPPAPLAFAFSFYQSSVLLVCTVLIEGRERLVIYCHLHCVEFLLFVYVRCQVNCNRGLIALFLTSYDW
jgi:hypothetical protein